MGWTIRRAAALVAVPWRNGLGTTRDVVTVLAADGTLDWQVSIADLVRDAAFSVFPGCDRVFTPIAGEPPPALAFGDGGFEPCPLLVPKRFAGDVPTRSRIVAPGRAFNVVADRGRAIGVTVVRGAGTVPLPEGMVVLYCHAGTVEVGGERLAAGDSAVGPGEGRVMAAGAAVVLVAGISGH